MPRVLATKASGCEPRAKKGLAAAVSKSFPSRVRSLRGYRGKRNLITDFCDKVGSSMLRPTRNKWGEAACVGRSLCRREEIHTESGLRIYNRAIRILSLRRERAAE